MKTMLLAAGLTLSAGLQTQAAQSSQTPPPATAATAPKSDAKTAPTIAGKWNMSSEINGQTMTSVLELKLDGKTVTGTTTSERMGTMPLEGEFADNKLTFSVTFNVQGNSMSITYTATFKDDKLTGTLTVPQMGEIPWTAERAKEK
jgi:glucose/arabinose dehydrogenase